MITKKAIRSLSYTLALSFLCLTACDDKKKETPPEEVRDSLVQQATEGSPPSPEKQIEKILKNYYKDLEGENPNIEDYYAPVVDKFYSADSFRRAKIGESLKRSFDRVENRRVEVDWTSLNVNEEGDTYVATFKGSTQYTEGKDKKEVNSDFFNQLTFDSDFRILKYEDASAARELRQTQTSLDGVEAKELYQPLLVITSSLRKGNLSPLSTFIHPDYGTYLITQPGAISIPYKCKQVNELAKHAYWLEKGDPGICKLPRVASLPSFTCASQFSKEGCFFDKLSQPYSGLTQLMKTLEDAEITRYAEAPLQDATRLEKLVSHQMIDTPSYLSLYFGKIEGSWYLLVIDLATYDCSA